MLKTASTTAPPKSACVGRRSTDAGHSGRIHSTSLFRLFEYVRNTFPENETMMMAMRKGTVARAMRNQRNTLACVLLGPATASSVE